MNSSDLVHDVEVVDGLPGGDHDAVHFRITAEKRVLSRSKRKVYNFRKANFDQFRDLLSLIPWSQCILGRNIEDDWSMFKDLLFSVADDSIPRVTLHPKKRKHWLSEDTLHMVRKKKRAFKLAKRTKKGKDLRRYKDISNRVRDLARMDHKQHLEEITKNLVHNQRPFWRWLKNMLATLQAYQIYTSTTRSCPLLQRRLVLLATFLVLYSPVRIGGSASQSRR